MDVEVDTQCCRTCLKTTTDNFLFDDLELVKKLEFTTSLRVNQSDGLPVYFCNSCNKKLEVAYQFRLQSIRSFKYLKNHIKQIQNQFQSIVKGNNNKLIQHEEKDTTTSFIINNDHTLSEQQQYDDDDNEPKPTQNKEKPSGKDPLNSKTNHKKNKINTIKQKEMDELKFENNVESFCVDQKNTKSSQNVTTKSNEDVFNENDGVEFSKCDICQKMFRKANLRRHKQTHTRDNKFTCKICDKTFTQKSSLHRHDLTHTGEKPYTCKTCGKKFSQSKTLKFHMSLHGEDKTFNCSICRYRFIKAENLANHIREKHSSENTDEVVLFVCQFCNKGFKSKYTLKIHKEKLHKDDIVFDMDWSDINNDDSSE